MYVVIMAGGGGTRLWPLSSPERPKPFLPLLGDRTLLQMTVDRLAVDDRLGLRPGDIAVVTDRRYAGFVRDQLPAATVLEEPVGRNTAAAVALAAHGLNRPGDEVMLVLPADHRIADEAGFRDALATAAGITAAEPDALVTLGIRATGPEPGYGYIVVGRRPVESLAGAVGFAVERFVEKPAPADAERLLAADPPAAWNAGIFVWRRSAILAALDAFAADISGAVARGLAGGTPGTTSGDGLDEAYAAVRATSIDYAVMEPASEAGLVRTLPLDVGWSDLGSWSVLLDALGGVGTGRVVQPGEAAEAGPDDLIVERIDGRLVLDDGPRGILAGTPVALLTGARPARDVVDALLERVARQEAKS
jgi:mannose-1-phosphate guanylyltransferase/mannose-6-phosphate isomerase